MPTRQVSEKGIRFIMLREGWSATVYLCSANYWTIGYGHMIRGFDKTRDTRQFMDANPYPNGISTAQAEKLLDRDLDVAERAVERYITAPLNDAQFDALVSFTYNLGAGALQRSTLRRVVNREDHEEVRREFMKWVNSGGKRVKGLIIRRGLEADLYESGLIIEDDVLPWLR